LRLALHEIRQPLAAVMALVEAARGHRGLAADVRGYLDQIVDQIQEVSGAASSVLAPRDADHASASVPVDVDDLIDSVVHAYHLTWSGSLTRRGDRGAVTSGDRADLRRCLVNVLDNAVRAAGPAGRVTVTVRRGKVIGVDVEDDGPGFGHVPTGSGLGLAATRQVLESVGGDLSVGVPSRTGGARVILFLPVHADQGYSRPVLAG
jgi:signal transduction histidine kinase